jgi:hypothetical protein
MQWVAGAGHRVADPAHAGRFDHFHLPRRTHGPEGTGLGYQAPRYPGVPGSICLMRWRRPEQPGKRHQYFNVTLLLLVEMP